MRQANRFYKSLDIVNGQLQLSTIVQGKKKTSQTIQDILKNEIILPNTSHFSLPKRLCVNAINGWYAGGSYRKNGIFFETLEEPDYCCPFDIMLLTKEAKNITATNSSEFIGGYEQFLFQSLEGMLKKYSAPVYGESALNQFRRENGEEEVEVPIYNECGFFRTIKIKPLALYGEDTRKIAQEFNLEHHGDVLNLSRDILYSRKYLRQTTAQESKK